MKSRLVAFALPLLSLASAATAQDIPDSCEEQIPRSLANALERAFPGFRKPLEYDNAPEDIAYSKSHGGRGCLGVATGDFTGEGKKDYIIGMTAKKGGGGLAVIVRPRKGGWSFQEIASWGKHRRVSQYVDVVPPGKYDRVESAAGALAKDERASLTCAHSGVQIGTIEATGVVYCFVDGQWLHVVVSN